MVLNYLINIYSFLIEILGVGSVRGWWPVIFFIFKIEIIYFKSLRKSPSKRSHLNIRF